MKFSDLRYRLRDAFRTAMVGGIIIGTLGGIGTYLYGLPNGTSGRKTLEDIGIKVVEDKGHPAFGFGGGSGLFSSTFTIQAKDGSLQNVVVSQGLTNRTSITFER